MRQTIQLKNIEIEYYRFGSGDELLIAFHGFDGQAEDFKVLTPSLGKKYTVLAVNLPFHGTSNPDPSVADYVLTDQELKNLIRKILHREDEATTFSVLGYSLGGRIALQSVLLFGKDIREMILMAPDGIRMNHLYRFATHHTFGNRIFRRVTLNPARFFGVLKLFKTLRLAHHKEYNFLKTQLSSDEKRLKIWNVWMSHRLLRPNLTEVAEVINREAIHVYLIFGKYDSIIPPSVGKKFQGLLKQKNRVFVIEAGHNFFKEKTNADLNKILAIKN